jgi:hypothetical protein
VVNNDQKLRHSGRYHTQKKGVAPGVIKGVFEVFPKQVKKIIFTCITCTGNYTWSCDVLFGDRVRFGVCTNEK